MKRTKEKIKTTTLSVDAATREKVNAEAARLGLNQREMIERLVESYQSRQKESQGDDAPDAETVLDQVNEKLTKVLQRDDRLVSFIREQESSLLNPILRTVQSVDTRLDVLVDVLKEMD